MTHNRRDMLGLTAAAIAASAIPAAAQEAKPRYGLIGQMLSTPGQRDALVAILTAATGGIPGCLSYVVALDTANPDAIWITEIWDSRESHAASLKLPAVRAAIAKARPIIAGFPQHFETVPVAGM
ncbi:putative quinol monooxygenase [Sphingobium limneticum]|uniref:Antibiotic biosynthesis monooxygenase n=1 Tax=Sphingobium limneticum TaxID=1007511 RepID=A0A5J5HYQ2_9SPHN|nr:putative quinol monooxygenase [Sphingobium limneticum]KAA9015848.1 antibiotic biosynthesis monooxygenase [Sphingobium limneticum]KAA9028261.1 antibiotic biosynthesis monooxygenase [Sphingobium limneticum]